MFVSFLSRSCNVFNNTQLTENIIIVIAQDRSPNQQNSARINLGRLFRWLFLTLILPMSLAIALDYLLNLQPFITILAIIIVIPLATFLVVRVIIEELNRVLRLIAPEESISPPLAEAEIAVLNN